MHRALPLLFLLITFCLLALPSMVDLSLIFSFRSFSTVLIFMGWDYKSHTQPLTWRTRISLFVWIITLNMWGMGGTTSSYATASICSQDHWSRKLHHYLKVGIPSGRVLPLLLWSLSTAIMRPLLLYFHIDYLKQKYCMSTFGQFWVTMCSWLLYLVPLFCTNILDSRNNHDGERKY
jgi:hypothetical protein